jgi:hypothetical protein
MVVIDATILMLFLRPDVGVPTGPGNVPIDRPRERVEFLVNQLEKARTRIVIPAPVLSEVLVRVPPAEAQNLVEQLGTYSVFRIEPFEARAAIELAIMTRNAIDGGRDPKRRNPQATWAKLKFDRQVIAIAKVLQATTIYSDDGDIRRIAKRENIEVIGLADLPLPSEDPQIPLQLEAPADVRETEEAGHSPPDERDDGKERIETDPIRDPQD